MWRGNKLATLGLLCLALGGQTPLFQILTTHLPVPKAGEAYHAQLKAEGGTAPYHWAISHGRLPRGLRLNAGSGEITGRAASSEAFAVVVEVRDSARPPLTEYRLLPASAGAPLALHWFAAPEVEGDHVRGTIGVGNRAGESVRLTVIAVAVNQTGKAFALRYDHRTLAPDEATGKLAFDVFLPPGTYSVQVDAVGEVSKEVIYRQRLSVPGVVVP